MKEVSENKGISDNDDCIHVVNFVLIHMSSNVPRDHFTYMHVPIISMHMMYVFSPRLCYVSCTHWREPLTLYARRMNTHLIYISRDVNLTSLAHMVYYRIHYGIAHSLQLVFFHWIYTSVVLESTMEIDDKTI